MNKINEDDNILMLDLELQLSHATVLAVGTGHHVGDGTPFVL